MSLRAQQLCAITSNLRKLYHTADFCTIAEDILGKRYELSIVLIGDAKARSLNIAHRGKHTAANVLSFPLGTESGEIFINIARARREAHRFFLSTDGHVRYLLIHGCLHLKGHTHGGTMERAERLLLKRYHIH